MAADESEHRAAQYREMDEFRSALILLDLRMSTILDAIKMLHPVSSPVLPPMREPTDSSNDLARYVGEAAAIAIETEQRDKNTPSPDITKIAQIIEDPVKTAIVRLKAEQWDKYQADLAVKESQNNQLSFLNAKLGINFKWSLLGIAVTALGWAIDHFWPYLK